MNKTIYTISFVLVISLILIIYQNKEELLSPPEFPNLEVTATCPSNSGAGREGLFHKGYDLYNCVNTEKEAKEASGSIPFQFCPSYAQEDFRNWDEKNCKDLKATYPPSVCTKNTNGPFCTKHYWKWTRVVGPYQSQNPLIEWLVEDEIKYCFYVLVSATAQCEVTQSRSNY